MGTTKPASLAAAVGSALALVAIAGARPAGGVGVPQPVSPGAAVPGAVAEARCPTFSWGGVPGATGYEIAVFRVAVDAEREPVLVRRATVAGDARAYTPPVGLCLERGRRYAWSVAALHGDRERDERLPPSEEPPPGSLRSLVWSPAFLFDVDAAPSADEVERALQTLERYLDDRIAPNRGAAVASPASERVTERAAAESERNRTVKAQRERTADVLPGALSASTTDGVVREALAASTPIQGQASLAVAGQVHLAAASAVFKDDDVFLWDDDEGNTALGRSALASVTGNADHNTAFGRGALRSTHGGPGALNSSFNTAVGDRALSDNTIGWRNTASGAYALRANVDGFHNTASGAYALRYNTSGFSNTACGMGALLSNTTGYRNTGSGTFALAVNTTGDGNTASGAYALNGNTSGVFNTSIGAYALRANTIGVSNTASGAHALLANTSGYVNTANGASALRSNTTGVRNTATGASALYDNTTGYANTAAGQNALHDNTTGDRNIAIGYRAGFYNTTGDRSIFIYNFGDDADDNTIKIGTQGTQLTTFIAGIRGVTTATANAIPVLISSTGQLGTTSSSRALKRDIQDLGPLADRLLDLHPVAFRFRQHVAADPDTPLEFGLIAEEVAEVLPELVAFDEEGAPQTVKYHLLASLLLGALQRQHAALERQERAKEEQRARLERQERALAAQQAELRRLAESLRQRAVSSRHGDE